jgi:hypothetical protein
MLGMVCLRAPVVVYIQPWQHLSDKDSKTSRFRGPPGGIHVVNEDVNVRLPHFHGQLQDDRGQCQFSLLKALQLTSQILRTIFHYQVRYPTNHNFIQLKGIIRRWDYYVREAQLRRPK